MDTAGRFIKHIASRQYLLLFTFQLKPVLPFKDVAKNETRMSMFGRSRVRWEGQLKDGHLPAIEANWRKFPLVDRLYAGFGARFRTIQDNVCEARQTSQNPRHGCLLRNNRCTLGNAELQCGVTRRKA